MALGRLSRTKSLKRQKAVLAVMLCGIADLINTWVCEYLKGGRRTELEGSHHYRLGNSADL